jgi:hypothetical protein
MDVAPSVTIISWSGALSDTFNDVERRFVDPDRIDFTE